MSSETHVLVWSSNAGRYCFDDPETGHDITSGEPLALEVMDGLWVEGRVEQSAGDYAGPGCYTIADGGRARRQARPNQFQSLDKTKAAVSAAMEDGASLEQAFRSVNPQTSDLFFGYYFVNVDGQAIGLCTGMRVRQP